MSEHHIYKAPFSLVMDYLVIGTNFLLVNVMQMIDNWHDPCHCEMNDSKFNQFNLVCVCESATFGCKLLR